MRLPWLWKLISVSVLPAMLLLCSCSEPLAYKGDINDPYVNYDALCDIVAKRYCFLKEKNIDWDSLARSYRAQVKPDMDVVQLFTLMGELLDNLKDGHVNLSAPFATSYYKKWWSDYPQDYDERTLQQYYLKFGGMQKGGMTYAIFLPDTIGYLRIPSFSTQLSPVTLDYILTLLSPSKGLIIDVRNNGGGYLTNVPELVGRFIEHPVTGGYIRHKTGPGPEDFSTPFRLEYNPADNGHVRYLEKPVMVLTNRSCFSAANDFVSVMKELPMVTILGSATGGGGGIPFSSELPNGWGIRFSACPINNARDEITEFGIEPDIEAHCSPQEFADGVDNILDTALKLILKQ